MRQETTRSILAHQTHYLHQLPHGCGVVAYGDQRNWSFQYKINWIPRGSHSFGSVFNSFCVLKVKLKGNKCVLLIPPWVTNLGWWGGPIDTHWRGTKVWPPTKGSHWISNPGGRTQHHWGGLGSWITASRNSGVMSRWTGGLSTSVKLIHLEWMTC